MHRRDKEFLYSLFQDYTVKQVATILSEIALEVAGDLSDEGFKEQAKELTVLSVALENIFE